MDKRHLGIFNSHYHAEVKDSGYSLIGRTPRKSGTPCLRATEIGFCAQGIPGGDWAIYMNGWPFKGGWYYDYRERDINLFHGLIDAAEEYERKPPYIWCAFIRLAVELMNAVDLAEQNLERLEQYIELWKQVEERVYNGGMNNV